MNILWQQLNWFDYSIIGVLLLSVVISFFRGFLREAISLTTWVVAILLALKFAKPASVWLAPYIAAELLRYGIAFVAIFIIVFAFGWFINSWVYSIVSRSAIGMVDRLFGVIFGAARGLIAAAIIIMFVQASPLGNQAWYHASQLAPQFQPVIQWMIKFLPEHITAITTWFSSHI